MVTSRNCYTGSSAMQGRKRPASFSDFDDSYDYTHLNYSSNTSGCRRVMASVATEERKQLLATDRHFSTDNIHIPRCCTTPCLYDKTMQYCHSQQCAIANSSCRHGIPVPVSNECPHACSHCHQEQPFFPQHVQLCRPGNGSRSSLLNRPGNGSRSSLLNDHFNPGRGIYPCVNQCLESVNTAPTPTIVSSYESNNAEPVIRVDESRLANEIGEINLSYKKGLYLMCILNVMFLTFNAVILPKFVVLKLTPNDNRQNCLNCSLLKVYNFDIEEPDDGICCFNHTDGPLFNMTLIEPEAPVVSFIQLRARATNFIEEFDDNGRQKHKRMCWIPNPEERTNMEIIGKDYSIILIKRSGFYFAYSRIQYKKDFSVVNSTVTSGEMFSLGHSIYKLIDKSEDEMLDNITQRCSVLNSNIAHASVLQSVIKLYKRDEIYLRVDHTDFLDTSDNRIHQFGLFHISDIN